MHSPFSTEVPKDWSFSEELKWYPSPLDLGFAPAATLFSSPIQAQFQCCFQKDALGYMDWWGHSRFAQGKGSQPTIQEALSPTRKATVKAVGFGLSPPNPPFPAGYGQQ